MLSLLLLSLQGKLLTFDTEKGIAQMTIQLIIPFLNFEESVRSLFRPFLIQTHFFLN